MKTFFLKSLLFFLLCLGISISITETIPYYYGNKFFDQKLNYYNEHSGEINLVVFGASSIHHQFSPQVFDTLLHTNNISSFNFGVEATMNPESYFLYEHFIESLDSGQIKYAILEITPLKDISNRNLLKERSSYWNSSSCLSYSYSYLKETAMPTSNKSKFFAKYIISYAYKFLDLTKVKHLFRPQRTESILKLRGFEPYLNSSVKPDELLKENHRRMLASKIFEQDKSKRIQANSAHLKRLRQLKELSAKKGIILVLLISPRQADYNNIFPFVHSDFGAIISLANHKGFPEFYDVNYLYDIGHLNNEGAVIYTEYLAREFEKIIR